jgi:hypothetical protein
MEILTRAFDCGRISTREEALDLAATALYDPDFTLDEPKIPLLVATDDPPPPLSSFNSPVR